MVVARECLRNPVGRINRVKTFYCESYFTYGCRNLLCLLFIVLIYLPRNVLLCYCLNCSFPVLCINLKMHQIASPGPILKKNSGRAYLQTSLGGCTLSVLDCLMLLYLAASYSKNTGEHCL